MDFADGGDLAKRINKAKTSRTHIPESTCLDWFTQMCLGMKHVHDRKIIHRDLKAQNVFLMGDDSIRLGDFGVARVLDYTVAKAQTQVGTPYYIAPEILKGRAYTNKADVWSLGILLFEICALDVPIKAANLHDLYKRIMNFRRVPALPRQYSASVTELISSMLNVDASKRPSVADLLAHPALKDRIEKWMNAEELKEEFDHTVLHKQRILDESGSKKARPYSARSNASKVEEVKRAPASREVRPAKAGIGRALGKPPAEGLAGRGSGDRFAAKKVVKRPDENKPPAQMPRYGLGARKNSAGALHAHKLVPGMNVKNSPRGNNKYSFGDKYGRPNPSQTPRNNGAAGKLAAGAPVGFQRQRPGSAAYAGYKAAQAAKAKPMGVNNRRFY